jgi:hypothetical protein
MKFDSRSALQYAREGRVEEWIHAYLMGGEWANPGLSDGLKLRQRWWRGPVEVPLSTIKRVVGPEPGMEYVVRADYWQQRTAAIAESIRAAGDTPFDLPPLIIHYAGGAMEIRDGNHRYGAYERLGWQTCWVLVWYDSQEERDGEG